MEEQIQEDFIGKQAAESLGIDYDENELLAAEFETAVQLQEG